jgi:hypothetical protein
VKDIAMTREVSENLLEALRYIVALLEDEEHWPTRAEHLGPLSLARAAIAKAEGSPSSTGSVEVGNPAD